MELPFKHFKNYVCVSDFSKNVFLKYIYVSEYLFRVIIYFYVT